MLDRSAPQKGQSDGERSDEEKPKRKLGLRKTAFAFPAKGLHLLGLLIAFILLVAASGFAATHPALTATLVFAFTLPYLLAAVATRRAHFLYATMLLGAASYFLTCHALGAPGATFPLLSVPLVVCLWAVGSRLRQRLPSALVAFPRTVFRAMNITIAVFTTWALVQAPRFMAEPGLMRYVLGLTLFCYAGLYLKHCVSGAHVVYLYIFSMCLAAAAIASGTALWSVDFGWLPALVAAWAILFVGTKLHRDRTYTWSRHLYFSAAGVMLVSLGLSAWSFSSFVLELALASSVLWVGYQWLADAVGDVRHAIRAERVAAKWLFLCSLGLTAPLAPPAVRHRFDAQKVKKWLDDHFEDDL